MSYHWQPSPRHGSSTFGNLKGTSNVVHSKSDQDLSTQINFIFFLLVFVCLFKIRMAGPESICIYRDQAVVLHTFSFLIGPS